MGAVCIVSDIVSPGGKKRAAAGTHSAAAPPTTKLITVRFTPRSGSPRAGPSPPVAWSTQTRYSECISEISLHDHAHEILLGYQIVVLLGVCSRPGRSSPSECRPSTSGLPSGPAAVDVDNGPSPFFEVLEVHRRPPRIAVWLANSGSIEAPTPQNARRSGDRGRPPLRPGSFPGRATTSIGLWRFLDDRGEEEDAPT